MSAAVVALVLVAWLGASAVACLVLGAVVLRRDAETAPVLVPGPWSPQPPPVLAPWSAQPALTEAPRPAPHLS